LNQAEKKYGTWDLPKEDVQIGSEMDMDREPLLTWAPKAKKTHPMNYFVPNFGVDHEIKASQVHEGAAEASLSHDWVLKKDENDKWILPPKSVEFHLLQTGATEDVEREPLLGWAPKPKKGGHPVDYPVANFGVDHEIASTQASIASTEVKMSHNWTPTLKKDLPKPHPVNYAVANFGKDHDIKTSLKNLKVAEKKYGTWDLPKDE